MFGAYTPAAAFTLIAVVVLLLAIVTDRALASLDRRVTRIESRFTGRESDRNTKQ